MYHLANGAYRLAIDDVEGADNAFRRAIETSTAIDYPFHEAISRVSFAQLRLLAGDFGEVERQLAAAAAALARSASEGLRFRLDLTRAAYLLARGRREEGLDCLRDALASGKELGARRASLLRPLTSSLLGEALVNDIEPDYVRMLIRNVTAPPPDDAMAQWPWPLKIVTLGGFALFREGEPLQLSRKTPRRLFNLMKAIVAFGGRDIAQEKIIDAVWPDEDGDSARQSFDVAVHRLRKLLGDGRAIVVKGGNIGFDPSLCFLDTWAFEKTCARRDLSPKAAERGLPLYRGAFLAGDEDLPWAAPLRDRLRTLYVKAVEARASDAVAAGEFARAEKLYRAGLAACPDAETLFQGFSRCCETKACKEEAIQAYRKLRAALADADKTPSPATTARFRALSAQQAH
jgi:LuxR family maltose regulon positive regulatory protein